MKFIPYSCQEITEGDLQTVRSVLQSDFLTQGPEIEKFERLVAGAHNCNYAIAVCNATAALHIACMALELGSGDLMWTSPNSFVASANCGRYCGADVDFVDIDPITRNMSLVALKAKLESAAIKGRLPKLIIPVDFSGLPCDLFEFRALADQYGFKIVSDSSHAVGATYKGMPIGNLADITVFSFHPVKIITTGEGGLCLTNDEALAKRLGFFRTHGITRDPTEMGDAFDGPWSYGQMCLGYNYRLTDIQAALGSSQLARLPIRQAKREHLARRYDQLLSDLPLKLPVSLDDRTSAHHLYVVEIEKNPARVNRRFVFDKLHDNGIGANVHYMPIHLQPYYQTFGFKRGDFPASEAYYDNAITIPLFPTMTELQQNHVASILTSALSL